MAKPRLAQKTSKAPARVPSPKAYPWLHPGGFKVTIEREPQIRACELEEGFLRTLRKLYTLHQTDDAVAAAVAAATGEEVSTRVVRLWLEWLRHYRPVQARAIPRLGQGRPPETDDE